MWIFRRDENHQIYFYGKVCAATNRNIFEPWLIIFATLGVGVCERAGRGEGRGGIKNPNCYGGNLTSYRHVMWYWYKKSTLWHSKHIHTCSNPPANIAKCRCYFSSNHLIMSSSCSSQISHPTWATVNYKHFYFSPYVFFCTCLAMYKYKCY